MNQMSDIVWDSHWRGSWGFCQESGVSAIVLPLPSGLWDYRVLPPLGSKISGWHGVERYEVVALKVATTIANNISASLAPKPSVWDKFLKRLARFKAR